MRNKIFTIIVFSTAFLKAQMSNLAPSSPVTDEHFGIKIIDEYRNLENLKDSKVLDWMKSQSDFTNSLLTSIPNRNYYLGKRLEFDKRQGYSVSGMKITNNDKYFYLKRNVGEKTEKVYYRNGFNGNEELLYDPTNFISKKKPGASKNSFVINLISPSWDGSKIAISLTQGGKELSEIIVMDVDKKYIHPETIVDTNPSTIGGIKWLSDNSGFFYVYYPIVDLQSSEFRKNTRSVLYKMGDDPTTIKDVFSSIHNPDLKISKDDYPAILTFNPDDDYYIGILVDAEKFRRTFITRKKDLLQGKKNNWSLLYDKDSKVNSLQLIGNDIYFLSAYNSPNYKLCKTNVKDKNFKEPQVLIPEKNNEVIKQYTITKDGIYYVTSKNGVEAKLYFYHDGKEIEVKLPYVSGSIDLQSKGKNSSDLWIICSGWANDEQRFKYNLSTKTFKAENLAPVIEYPEFKDIIAEEVSVKSYDGTEVPLSLIYNKNIIRDGKNPVLINCYGAFGESSTPFFAKSYLLWVNQGGIVAIPHVRGGGEKGTQWHIDGKKSKKPNSWKDLIACTEYLIHKRLTSSDKVAIWGASAGGIVIGRAITEKPDLFKVAIVESGVLNTTRFDNNGIQETSIKEYGNPNDSIEFKDLLEMDSYQHIKKGTKYPATLLYAGINDPRIAPWQSSKFFAKLLPNTISSNPALLRIDYKGGHGGDIPIEQRYSNLADIFAFALWQLGHPDYQIKKDNTK